MPIRYKTSGDKFRAGQLFGEGRHQLSILKNAMKFQGLQQLQKVTTFDNGTIIKCLSCFGHDLIDIFIPLPVGEKAIMPRERMEIKIYPAFEAYDGNTYASNFIGIVLCKGGGFEPPYEFIAKESLPRDLSDEPKEPLPKERIWWDYYRGDLDDVAIPKSRRLEDLVPLGIAEPVKVNLAATVSTCEVNKTGANYPYKECQTEPKFCSAVGSAVKCPRYRGGCAEFFSYSRAEHFEEHYGISYNPDGPHTERWSGYTYEGAAKSGKLKPVNLLNFQPSFFSILSGSGTNHFQEILFPEVVINPCAFTCTEWLFGICVDGFWDCTGDTDAETPARALITPQITTYDFERRAHFYSTIDLAWNSYNYVFNEQGVHEYSDYWGSILNSDEYAIVYSESTTDRVTTNSKESPSDEDTIALLCFQPSADFNSIKTVTGGESTGALIVGLDTEIIQVKPSSELMYSNVRYHQVGEQSIGLFFVVENDPFEYMYVYASALEGETECIQTQVFDVVDYSFYHEIPDITNHDDNPVYGNGQMRLVRETITQPEEPINL